MSESVENTSGRDNFEHVLGVLSQGQSGYIEGMEAQGQRQLLAASQLPVNGPWGELKALGFVPGPPVPGDDLFRSVQLPEGWHREGSDHAMWSYITDERGVRRVAVFYKAAFYDRRAFCRLENVGEVA